MPTNISYRQLFHLLPNMETRKITAIPILEEQPLTEILGAKCPTKGEVFKYFYYLRHCKSKSIAEATKTATKAAKVFWTQAGIVTKKDRFAAKDLQKICEEYKVETNSIRKALHVQRKDIRPDIPQISLS